MQTRLIALGDPVVAKSIQQILESMSAPGIWRGMELTAPAADQIAVLPGEALTDSGVVVIEDEIRTLPFNLTVAPSNFTIYYQYQPSETFGGSPADLQIQAGLIPIESFSSGVLLGWVRYPGGSVPLNAQAHFVSAPRVRVGAPPRGFMSRYAPFNWNLKSVSGPSPVILDQWNGPASTVLMSITNTGISLSTSEIVVPVQVPEGGLRRLSIEAQVDAAATLTVSVLDHLGGVVSTVPPNLISASALQQHILDLPFALDLEPGSQAFVRFACAIQPSNFIRIKSIGITADASP